MVVRYQAAIACAAWKREQGPPTASRSGNRNDNLNPEHDARAEWVDVESGGFPNRGISDSRCLLELEASMHGPTVFERSS
jgi:hypothetical protein